MFSSPTSALILRGSEYSHRESAIDYFRFLTQEVGIPHDGVNYEINGQSASETKQLIRNFFGSLPSWRFSNAVVVYVGHGFRGVFHPYGHKMSYEEFASMFKFRGDFIFINESCYSGSCVGEFQFQRLLPDKGLVITSSAEDENSHTAVFKESLFERFRSGSSYGVDMIAQQVEVADFSKPEQIKSMSKRQRELIEWSALEGKPQFEVLQHPVRTGKDLEHLLFTRA